VIVRVSLVSRPIFALALVAVFMSAGASAAQDTCEGQGEAIIRNAYPDARPSYDGLLEIDGDDGGDTIMPPTATIDNPGARVMICREWPARPGLLLVAMPIVSFWSNDFTDGDIDILVLDYETLAVRQRLLLKDAMLGDAVSIEKIALDTALYQLTPHNLAFGLRLSRANNSKAIPFEETVLRLFSIEAGALKLVLDKLTVEENRGEWLAVCNGEFRNTKRRLVMAKSEKGQVADILLADAIVTTRLNITEPSEKCETREENSTARHRLRFRDGAYVVPEALRGL
jgi:hypothetical protein